MNGERHRPPPATNDTFYQTHRRATARRVVAPYEIIVPLLSNNTISIIAAVQAGRRGRRPLQKTPKPAFAS
jgi:hypothetical protein